MSYAVSVLSPNGTSSVRDCSLTLTRTQISTKLEWASLPAHSHYTNRYTLGWGIASAARMTDSVTDSI